MCFTIAYMVYVNTEIVACAELRVRDESVLSQQLFIDIYDIDQNLTFRLNMAAAADFDILPGLRDYSGATTSKGGIDEMLAVIHHLSAAEVPSCVIGVKALRYYGAARITDVGNDMLT